MTTMLFRRQEAATSDKVVEMENKCGKAEDKDKSGCSREDAHEECHCPGAVCNKGGFRGGSGAEAVAAATPVCVLALVALIAAVF